MKQQVEKDFKELENSMKNDMTAFAESMR